MKQDDGIATLQFQVGKIDRFGPKQATGNLISGERYIPAVASLVLGRWLRGYLTSSELQILKLIAPERGSITFIDDNKIGQTDLLKGTTIDSCAQMSREAIFTQQLRNGDRTVGEPMELHTAYLGNDSTHPVTLGIISPTNTHRDKITKLVETFRTGWSLAESACKRLSESLTADSPLLLVNQTSARIMYVSSPFCQLIESTEKEILDKEYSQIQPRLEQLQTNHRLTIKRYDGESLQLSLLKAEPLVPEEKMAASEDIFHDFFLHKARNLLAVITAASSYLNEVAREREDAEFEELTGMVGQQAFALEHHFERLELLLRYADLPLVPCNLSEAIWEAVERVGDNYNCLIKTHMESLNGAAIIAPRWSAIGLIEAALSTVAASPRNCNASISAIATDHDCTVTIKGEAKETELQPRFSHSWQLFARKLAALMKVETEFTSDNENRAVILTLRFPTSRNRDLTA